MSKSFSFDLVGKVETVLENLSEESNEGKGYAAREIAEKDHRVVSKRLRAKI